MDVYNSKFALWFKQGDAKDWAITLGPITFYSVPFIKVDKKWRSHEDFHKLQWKKYWYVGFAILYLWELLIHGYKNNKFELEAQEYSKIL